jgi:hypothetical protein
MIINIVNRNNQINRGKRERPMWLKLTRSTLKKRKTQHQSQTTVVPNWKSPSSSTSSQSSVIQNKTLLTSQIDSETAKIIMMESFATIRNMICSTQWSLLKESKMTGHCYSNNHFSAIIFFRFHAQQPSSKPPTS